MESGQSSSALGAGGRVWRRAHFQNKQILAFRLEMQRDKETE
jgi:hypothetical protein